MTTAQNEQPDIRSRTVALERQMDGHHNRIIELEKWQRKSEISDARLEEQVKGMENRFNDRFSGVEKQIGEMADNIAWLVKLVLGGIIAGMITIAGTLIMRGMGV